MDISESTRRLRELRETGQCVYIPIDEMRCVSSNKVLSSMDKLIWINIIAKLAPGSNEISLELINEISDTFKKTTVAITRSIKNLKNQGFLGRISKK